VLNWASGLHKDGCLAAAQHTALPNWQAVNPRCCAGATAAAYYAARPKALRLLRQLAAASKAAARQLQETGLVRFALEQLLRPESAPAAASPATPGSLTQRRGTLTEALRLWRSYAQHGFYLLMLDDAYPSLCNFFSPPAVTAAADGATAALAAEELQQWCVAREAYSAAAQLCWHAARWARLRRLSVLHIMRPLLEQQPLPGKS
jgi:hypothetical protein